MQLTLIFLVVGTILFIGYLATIMFKRFKISSILILMSIGLLLGPVFHLVDVSEGSVIRQLSPVMGAIALITILFDAGTKMNIGRLIRSLPRASVFTVLVFVLTVLGVGTVLHYVFGWDWIYGLMFGAAVGGTSSPIVIPMVEGVSISARIKDLLALESTLTDVLCVLTVVVLIQILTSPTPVPLEKAVFGNLIAKISVSVFLGTVAAAFWIFWLIKIKSTQEYNYMLTVALVLILYAITEMSYGSGAIAVFVFGLVLAHRKELSQWIRIDHEFIKPQRFMMFQEEVTFFVRTFFFVYIGLLISTEYFTSTTIVMSCIVLVIALLSRKISQSVLLRDADPKEKKMVIMFLPRGLAAAVLASLPTAYGITIPYFEEGVFATVFLTNLFASFGVWVIEREYRSRNKQSSSEPSSSHREVLKSRPVKTGKTEQSKKS